MLRPQDVSYVHKSCFFYPMLTMHSSHCRPRTFLLHGHCPVSLLQTSDTEPLVWHWQAVRKKRHLNMCLLIVTDYYLNQFKSKHLFNQAT